MEKAEKRRKTGAQGEAAAAAYLMEQGYSLVARNWHCRGGELDIVAVKDGVIAFVEVKTRKVSPVVTPLEAVNKSKQRRVVTAAAAYLQSHSYDLQPRFDIAAVTQMGSSFSVEYYESAYDAGDQY